MSAENTPSGEDYPYDWGKHHELAQQLGALDPIDLMISRRQIETPLLQSLVLSGPYNPDSLPEKIDGNIIAAHMPVRLRRLTGLIYEQINLVRLRADIITRSAENVLSFFPEEKYHPSLAQLIVSAQMQLADLGERLDTLKNIMDEGSARELETIPLQGHQHFVMTLRSVFRDTAGFSDPVPVAERLPVLKSVYQQMSLLSLKQAGIEKSIAEECLSVTATDFVLRDVFNAQSNLSSAPFQNLASFSLLTGMIDLDYAAALRTGIYMMEQTNRPSFPVGSFLSAPECR